MSQSGILVVHLRGHIREDVMRDELARMLGLPIEDLSPLGAATQSTKAPYQYMPHSRGFLTTIELYAGSAPEPAPRSDLALAQYLARCFAQDALISPIDGDANPYHWLLVRPDGTTVGVTEVPPDEEDEEDGIVIA
jgi:hypothetical protein